MDVMREGGFESQDRSAGRRFRKTVSLVPSLFTTANVFCGFYSVMESVAGAQSLAVGDLGGATGHFDRAAICIGFSVLFDFLDGRIARMAGATSEFGLELDSIADVLSFGIAPAVLAYNWGYGQEPAAHKIAWAVSFLFVICGALRLARFNVLARQPTSHSVAKSHSKGFVGMPIPLGAGLIAAIAHFTPWPVYYTSGWSISLLGQRLEVEPYLLARSLIVLVAFLAFLMVSTIRYSSFKDGARNYHPRTLILVLALLVTSIYFYSRWSLLILAIASVSHGLAGKLWSLIKPRRREPVEHPDAELAGKPH